MEAPPPPGDGAQSPPPPIDWFLLVSSVAGGVALLNFSMSTVSRALRSAFGAGLRDAVRRATRTRAVAFLVGVLATALLSSATASSLLVLEFVNAGDMSLGQSLGLGLGIGVGSTLNAHLLAFSLHRYAMAMVAGGYAGAVWGGHHVVGRLCEAVMGLGLMFSATAIISGAITPLRGHGPFLQLLAAMKNPALAMASAAVAAVALQSSNTVIALAMVVLSQHHGTAAAAEGGAGASLAAHGTQVAAYLVLGANVGTALTPVLAALGRRREALRVAAAYFAMKAAGVALLLPLLPRFVDAVTWSTSAAQSRVEGAAYDAMVDHTGAAPAQQRGVELHQQLEALGRRAVLSQQVANSHTLANVWVALVCMPLLSQFAALVTWAVPPVAGDKGDGGGGGGSGPDGSPDRVLPSTLSPSDAGGRFAAGAAAGGMKRSLSDERLGDAAGGPAATAWRYGSHNSLLVEEGGGGGVGASVAVTGATAAMHPSLAELHHRDTHHHHHHGSDHGGNSSDASDGGLQHGAAAAEYARRLMARRR